MSYILILQERNYLPHAVRLEADTPDVATAEIAEVVDGRVMAVPEWLIELATGDVRRVFKVEDQVILSDTAFRSDLGIATPPDYFLSLEGEK